MRKVNSVIMQQYKDSIMKDLDRDLKALDSMRIQSVSTMKELEKA